MHNRLIIIKIGSSIVCNGRLPSLARDILKFDDRVIIVSSGAVAFGRKYLNYGNKELTLQEKQAASSCGQPKLMSEWQSAFGNRNVAQILLTANDMESQNVKNTLDELLNNGIIPIINENDAVATEELQFGNNDILAAQVAIMMRADLLMIISDVDGLYSENPHINPDAVFQERITEITPEIEAMGGSIGSSVGTGGMATKIIAAKMVTSVGCDMIIMKGDSYKHTTFVGIK